MRWFTCAAFVVLVACSAGPGHSGGPDGPGGQGEHPEPDPAVVVQVSKVGTGSVADDLVTSAVVESERQADLYPEASGTVVAVKKDEGDAVKKGEVLAVLDNVTLDAGAQQATASLEKAKKDFERIKMLHDQGAVSDNDLAEARYALEQARTSAHEATRSFGQTRITAPFDGVVAARDVRVGELATSGRRVFQVVDLTSLRVVASLPERDLRRVHEGQPARLVSAYHPNVWTQGTVQRIAPVVDPTSGTFRVTVGLDANQNALRPGQYVSVQLEVDRHQDVTVIPRKALLYEDGVPIAYVMAPAPDKKPEAEESGDAEKGGWLARLFSGKTRAGDAKKKDDAEAGPKFVAQRRLLDVGLVDSDWVEIDGGLSPGDEVVVVGQSNLKDGAEVLIPKMKVRRQAERDAKAKQEEGSADAGAGSEG